MGWRDVFEGLPPSEISEKSERLSEPKGNISDFSHFSVEVETQTESATAWRENAANTGNVDLEVVDEWTELSTLVDQVADHHGFTAVQQQEALEIAFGDPEAALDCFRNLAAQIAALEPTTDDRIKCAQCVNLAGRKCAAWKELGAACGWEPVQLPLRCPQFKPKASQADQRTGAERWGGFKEISE